MARFIRDFWVENPSPRTIEVYTEGARQFHAFLVQNGRPLDPAGIPSRPDWRWSSRWVPSPLTDH